MNSLKKIIPLALLVLLPLEIARAYSIVDVSNQILSVFKALTYFLVGLAVLIFLWGIVVYLAQGENEEKRTEAKNYMVWGIISLVVMTSLWGLVYLVTSSFGLGWKVSTTPTLPTLEY